MIKTAFLKLVINISHDQILFVKIILELYIVGENVLEEDICVVEKADDLTRHVQSFF